MKNRLAQYGLVCLFLILMATLLGAGGMWLAHFIFLETVLTAVPSEGFQTPGFNEDIAWASVPGADLATGNKVFRGANAFLSGTCFPTEPALDVKGGDAQNGFRELFHVAYPGRNLYRSVGLNFEHILSGRAGDEPRNWFSPRKEACELRVKSERSVSLFWPGESSAWGTASEMTYTLANGPCLDMTFRTTPRDPVDRPYLVYMWASYIRAARDQCIHFTGAREVYSPREGYQKARLQQVRFGEREIARGKNENAVVPYLGMPELERDDIPAYINIDDAERCAFVLPFFYGVMDGDGDLNTQGDDMVYLMMFDQAEPVRFVMFDFSGDMHQPVWDWQYVIRRPEPGRTYQYRARLVYKPFQGADDAAKEYVAWLKGLEGPRRSLDIAVEPPESGTLVPGDLDGAYGDGVRVYFGVDPAPGWTFDHWEGPVDQALRRYTGIRMQQDSRVRAVCERVNERGCGSR